MPGHRRSKGRSTKRIASDARVQSSHREALASTNDPMARLTESFDFLRSAYTRVRRRQDRDIDAAYVNRELENARLALENAAHAVLNVDSKHSANR